jgi:hypothetical protein
VTVPSARLGRKFEGAREGISLTIALSGVRFDPADKRLSHVRWQRFDVDHHACIGDPEVVHILEVVNAIRTGAFFVVLVTTIDLAGAWQRAVEIKLQEKADRHGVPRVVEEDRSVHDTTLTSLPLI